MKPFMRVSFAIILLLFVSRPVSAEGLLRIGLQLHNEPQQNRPCDPNGRLDYLRTCLVMDSLIEIFARHQAKITFEMGLGNAQSTPLWGGVNVRGSAQYMLTRPDVIHIGNHIHFPANAPGFRDKFCPPAPEDNIAETALTFEQYATAAARRYNIVRDATGLSPRGMCGLWSRVSALRWIPAASSAGWTWVTGWNNFNPPGGSTGGHAWCTAVNPWRVGHDLTNSYTGGVMDNFYNGPVVLLPDGAVSGRMNANTRISFALIDSLIHENWIASDPERINICYLTTHDYEFSQGGSINYAEFRAWDSLLTILDAHVLAGRAVYQDMDQMVQDFVAWEQLGNISYPPNGTFETRDTTWLWYDSLDNINEILEFKLFWAPLSGAANPSDGQDAAVRRNGRRSYRFGTASTRRGIGPSTNGKHIYAVVPPDTAVEFRVWCRSAGDAVPELAIRWYAAADTLPGMPHVSETVGGFVDSVAGDWRLLKLVANVPAGAAALRTCLYKSGTGTLWYDDANLRYAAHAPAPVYAVIAFDSDSGLARVRWTASPGAQEYRVYYDSLAAGAFDNFWTVAAPETSLALEINPARPVRFFRISAVRSAVSAAAPPPERRR